MVAVVPHQRRWHRLFELLHVVETIHLLGAIRRNAERLAETVTGNKARELSLKIEMAEELLLELAKETQVGQGTL